MSPCVPAPAERDAVAVVAPGDGLSIGDRLNVVDAGIAGSRDEIRAPPPLRREGGRRRPSAGQQ